MKERLKSEGHVWDIFKQRYSGIPASEGSVEYLLQKAFEGDLTFCKYRADNSNL